MRFPLTLIIFAVLIFSADSVVAQRASFPEVTFDYKPVFDTPCAALTKQPIEPEAVKELESRLDSLRGQWRREAPQLFGRTVKLTGVKFQFKETVAALSLCPDFPSTSLPLIINVRYFLTAIHGERADSITRFSFLVFHESIHRYVNDCIKPLPDKTTPLLTKYRDEPLPVRSHLHLISIMNEVYRSLGREKDLADLIAFEQNMKYLTILKRAREIVDKEGAQTFINELRHSRQSKKPKSN